MSSKASLQIFNDGYLVALAEDEVEDFDPTLSQFGMDEYRFSGFLDTATTLDGSLLTQHSMLTVAVRSGSVTVVGGSRTFTVTPGYPLHIPQGTTLGGTSYLVTPASPGAHVEILANLSNSADTSSKFLWLRADQGITTNDAGQVTQWVDTRSNSLCPSPFVYGVFANGVPFERNDDMLLETSDDFNGETVMKFRGQAEYNTAAYGRLLYSGTEFDSGQPAQTDDWTLVVVGRWFDTGAHQVVATSGYDLSVPQKNGAFVGVEGGGTHYVGTMIAGVQSYKTGTIELTDKPIIYIVRYDSAARAYNIHYNGIYQYVSEAFGTKPKWTNPMAIGGTHNLTAGPHNLAYQMFSGQLAELRYYPRRISDAEVLDIKSQAVAKYGINDAPGNTFPFPDDCVELFRVRRGLVYDKLTNEFLTLYDTRRKVAGSVPSMVVTATTVGVVEVSKSSFEGVDCALLTGDVVELGSNAAASVYAATSGGSSFWLGVVARFSSIRTAPTGMTLWHTSANYATQYGTLFTMESGNRWQPYVTNENAGKAILNTFGPSPVLAGAGPYPVSFVMSKSSSAATIRGVNGQYKIVADAFAESAQNPATALRIGGVVGLPSGVTAKPFTGQFFEAWYLTAITPTSAQLAQYNAYVEDTYGFIP